MDLDDDIDEGYGGDEISPSDVQADTLIYIALSIVEVGFLQALLVQTHKMTKDANVQRLCEDILEETVASEVELLDAASYDLH